jgi:GTP-binding protein
MRITQATFAGSSQKLDQRPKLKAPEFAFIGRSNVGKSSLINMLCEQKKLAHTSATPGKTRLVNHFYINQQWYLVDLPGYGYAKISKKKTDQLSDIITHYICKSEELVSLFVLLDCRLDIQNIDLEFMMKLAELGIPFSIIFTKGDKLGVNARAAQVEKNKKFLLQYWEELPPVFVSSAETGLGKDEILNYIDTTLKTL